MWLVLVMAVCLSSCNLARYEEPTEQPEAAQAVPVLDSERTAWHPDLRQTWQWQLSGEIDLSIEAEVYDLDLFETDSELVADLHARGKRVICYINVGAWEDWRDDRSQFSDSVLGKAYSGWKGERWLDIRQIEALAPVMQKRFDLCAAKGFDAVEPDNIDGYTNQTGFELTYEDQLAYNRWLADEAHARGLSIGLKNDPDQAEALVGSFDWAMTEDCFAEGWCGQMEVFTQAGKPVFSAEYTDTRLDFEAACEQAQALGFNLILKDRDLEAWRRTCDQ